jgi:hypothetical protein
VETTCYPRASVVKLESTTGDKLNAYEINMYSSGNDIAASGTATQSSTFNDKTIFEAYRGIDGDSTTFFHTGADDTSAWWQVALSQESEIESVEILNRKCGDNDIAECLCRMSSAKLSLIGEQGSVVVGPWSC